MLYRIKGGGGRINNRVVNDFANLKNKGNQQGDSLVIFNNGWGWERW